MTKFKHISLKELHNDRAASLMDIKIAEELRAAGAITLNGLPINQVIERNQQIIAVIDEELKARGETTTTP